MPNLTLDQPLMWGIAAASTLLAGFVRGFAGFGGPAIMTLILVQFYAPVSVLAKVILIDVLSNLKLLPSTAVELDRRVRARSRLSGTRGPTSGLSGAASFDHLQGRCRCLHPVITSEDLK